LKAEAHRSVTRSRLMRKMKYPIRWNTLAVMYSLSFFLLKLYHQKVWYPYVTKNARVSLICNYLSTHKQLRSFAQPGLD